MIFFVLFVCAVEKRFFVVCVRVDAEASAGQTSHKRSFVGDFLSPTRRVYNDEAYTKKWNFFFGWFVLARFFRGIGFLNFGLVLFV